MQAKVDQRNRDLREIVDLACEKNNIAKSMHNLRPLHVLDLKKGPLKRINLTEEFVLAKGPDPDSEAPIVAERCAPSHSGSVQSQKANGGHDSGSRGKTSTSTGSQKQDAKDMG